MVRHCPKHHQREEDSSSGNMNNKRKTSQWNWILWPLIISDHYSPTKLHSYPSNSCGDILVWTKVVDRPPECWEPPNTWADFKWQHLPHISRRYLISSTFNHNAPGTNVPVKQRVFLCGAARGGNTGALCPTSLLNNTPALKAGSCYWLEDIKKNAPFKAHTHSALYTHTRRWIKSARYQVLPWGSGLTCGGRGESNTQLIQHHNSSR